MSRMSVFRSRFFWKVYITFSLLFLAVMMVVWWTVAYRVRSSSGLADMASLHSTIGFVAVVGALVALAAGWWLARRVTVPLAEMVQVAEEMRRGNYSARVKTITNDEVGRLGDTLNRLGSELSTQVSELERLERVRRDFVANVSHEIKTPLTSIRGYVETLIEGAIHDQDNNLRFLSKIDRNASRLSQLVQDLLSLARIEADDQGFKAVPIEWDRIVSTVITSYEDSIQAKHLQVSISTQAAPLVVMGDREAMVQVLDNLITNGIKYTPASGHIQVSLSATKTHGVLTVKDNGIGIPAKYLDRIFERFYRIDKARGPEIAGTGLGLAIVKHLVARMNGQISVDSEVGTGSRFVVKLPLAK